MAMLPGALLIAAAYLAAGLDEAEAAVEVAGAAAKKQCRSTFPPEGVETAAEEVRQAVEKGLAGPRVEGVVADGLELKARREL